MPETPDNGTGYTALEYGTYHLMQICSEDLRKMFIRSFDSRYDSSRRIWSCALIYAVNGFRPLTAMSLLYRNSILSVTAPDLKLGETAMKNQLESLGGVIPSQGSFRLCSQRESGRLRFCGMTFRAPQP